MENLLSKEDIQNLHHTSMHCFCHEKDQEGRFEVLKGNINDIPKSDNGILYWYEDSLSALIAYNYYNNHTKYKAVLLYDLAERTLEGKNVTHESDRHCIAINKTL